MCPTRQASSRTDVLRSLRAQIDEIREDGARADHDRLVGELEKAHEELRLADEKVRSQQEELDDLRRLIDTEEGPLLARSLAELASLSVRTTERPALLAQVAHACQRAFPMRAFVSISLGPPDEPELVATDSKVAQHVDGAQMIAGEGPSQLAWDTGAPVVSAELGTDERWPRLGRAVQDEPPVSALAVPIGTGDDRLGTLNIYADDPALAAERWIRYGELLVATVAAVLQELDARAELETLAAHLRTAMRSRAPIEQAKGILMAARGCGPDEAFEILAAMSNHANVKIRELAERIVADAARGPA